MHIFIVKNHNFFFFFKISRVSIYEINLYDLSGIITGTKIKNNFFLNIRHNIFLFKKYEIS